MAPRSVFVVMSAVVAWASVTSCSKGENTSVRQTDPNSKQCDEVTPHAAEIACKENLAGKAEAEVGDLSAQYFEEARRLDVEFRRELRGETPQSDSFEAQARDSHEAWTKYVKRQCQFEEGTSFGGSGGGDFGAECRLRLSKQRAGELHQAIEFAKWQSVRK